MIPVVSMGPRFTPLVFLAVLTVVAWGIFAAAAALLGEIHVLSLFAAVFATAVLVAWPAMAGTPEKAPAMLQATACHDCGRMMRSGEAFGFCIRCGSVRTVKATLLGPRA